MTLQDAGQRDVGRREPDRPADADGGASARRQHPAHLPDRGVRIGEELDRLLADHRVERSHRETAAAPPSPCRHSIGGTVVAAAARATRNMSSLRSSPTTWPGRRRSRPPGGRRCRCRTPRPARAGPADPGQLDEPARPRRERRRQVALVGLGGVAVQLPARRRTRGCRCEVLAHDRPPCVRRAQCRMAAWAPTMTARPDPLLA